MGAAGGAEGRGGGGLPEALAAQGSLLTLVAVAHDDVDLAVVQRGGWVCERGGQGGSRVIMARAGLRGQGGEGARGRAARDLAQQRGEAMGERHGGRGAMGTWAAGSIARAESGAGGPASGIRATAFSGGTVRTERGLREGGRSGPTRVLSCYVTAAGARAGRRGGAGGPMAGGQLCGLAWAGARARGRGDLRMAARRTHTQAAVSAACAARAAAARQQAGRPRDATVRASPPDALRMPMGSSAAMRVSRRVRSLARHAWRLALAAPPPKLPARARAATLPRRLALLLLLLLLSGLTSLFLPHRPLAPPPAFPFAPTHALPPAFDARSAPRSAIITADRAFHVIVVVPPFTGRAPPPNPAYAPPPRTDLPPGSETYAPPALRLLLASLARAHYDNERVALRLVLAPEANASAFDARYHQCAAAAWPHGPKAVANATSGGLFELAVAAWNPPRTDPQKVLLVDASRATPLAPQYYRYLKSVRRRYAATASDVAGFTLDPVRLRRPASGAAGYTSDLVAEGAAGDEVFLYQNLPFVAAFSPVDSDVWRAFQRWFDAHRSEWFLWPTVVGAKDKSDSSWAYYRGTARAHWSLWFSRFCAEYGIYTVYPRRHRPEPLPPVGRASALPPLSRYDFQGSLVSPSQQISAANLEQIIELGRRQGGSVSLTVVNKAFLETARSWICNVDVASMRPPGVVWITTDDVAYEALRNVPNSQTVRMTEFRGGQARTGTSYATPGYWLLMLERTQLIRAILERGIGVFAFETDQVWLRDPVPFVQRLIHSGDEVDVVGTLDTRHEIGGNFLYLNPTLATRRVWREVCRRFEWAYKLNKMEGHTARYRRYMENDQSTLTKLIFFDEQFKTRNPVVFRALDTELFVDGRWYDKENKKYISPRSRSPIVINNNFLIGIENKMKRAMAHGHWFVASDGHTCEQRTVKRAIRDNERRAPNGIGLGDEASAALAGILNGGHGQPPVSVEDTDEALEHVNASRVEGADVEAGLDAAMMAIRKELSR